MSIHSTGIGSSEGLVVLVVSPRRAQAMLDVGHTRLYELIANGELESYRDGKSRKVTVSSIKAYIARRIEASRPQHIQHQDVAALSPPVHPTGDATI